VYFIVGPTVIVGRAGGGRQRITLQERERHGFDPAQRYGVAGKTSASSPARRAGF
jgi:hypothetical protein